MKKILFVFLCALTLCSCSSKQEQAKAIIEKYCYDFDVEQKAGETRYYKTNIPLFGDAKLVDATMALDDLYGKPKKDVEKDENPSNKEYAAITDEYYYWGGRKVTLHRMSYIYKGGSGGKVNVMFFVHDN